MNGFKTTGVWPTNINVYPGSAHAAADNILDGLESASR